AASRQGSASVAMKSEWRSEMTSERSTLPSTLVSARMKTRSQLEPGLVAPAGRRSASTMSRRIPHAKESHDGRKAREADIALLRRRERRTDRCRHQGRPIRGRHLNDGVKSGKP